MKDESPEDAEKNYPVPGLKRAPFSSLTHSLKNDDKENPTP